MWNFKIFSGGYTPGPPLKEEGRWRVRGRVEQGEVGGCQEEREGWGKERGGAGLGVRRGEGGGIGENGEDNFFSPSS